MLINCINKCKIKAFFKLTLLGSSFLGGTFSLSIFRAVRRPSGQSICCSLLISAKGTEKRCSKLSFLSNGDLWYDIYEQTNFNKDDTTYRGLQCVLRIQSQKTQGFCVADFGTLSDERRSRSKIVLLFNTGKRTLRSKI